MRNWLVDSLFGNSAHRTIGHVDEAGVYFKISEQDHNNVNVHKVYMINDRQYVHMESLAGLVVKEGSPVYNVKHTDIMVRCVIDTVDTEAVV